MYALPLLKKEAMSLESWEEYLEEFGRRKGRGECFKYIAASKKL